MVSNGESQVMQFRIIIVCVLLVGSFITVVYAGEAAISVQFHQFEESEFVHDIHFHPASTPIVCQQTKKSHCQSKPLALEVIDQEEIVVDSIVPYSIVRTSLAQSERTFAKKAFLNIEIYVDRIHRNFEAEILEIFEKSLAFERGQDGTPIRLECHCDDREPQAYSFVLGQRWGNMIQASLHNLTGHSPDIELLNYGKEYDICDQKFGDCQEGSRLQSTFEFLAIREPHSGCLIRLRIPAQNNLRQVVFEEHPLFLQEIHVAGIEPNSIR